MNNPSEPPLAQTSALPLFGVSSGLPGLHEGMFHPLPQLMAPETSDQRVTFVHIRQFQRICKRRRAIAAGGFSFDVEPKKQESRVIAAKQRRREHGAFVKAGAGPRSRAEGESDSTSKQQEQSDGAQKQEEHRKRSSGGRKPDGSEKDCGACIYCKDKRKFGGPAKLKKICIQRRGAKNALRDGGGSGSEDRIASFSGVEECGPTNEARGRVGLEAGVAWSHDNREAQDAREFSAERDVTEGQDVYGGDEAQAVLALSRLCDGDARERTAAARRAPESRLHTLREGHDGVVGSGRPRHAAGRAAEGRAGCLGAGAQGIEVPLTTRPPAISFRSALAPPPTSALPLALPPMRMISAVEQDPPPLQSSQPLQPPPPPPPPVDAAERPLVREIHHRPPHLPPPPLAAARKRLAPPPQ